MAEFHFLRPIWLVLLPVGAWLISQLLRGRGDAGGWRSVVAPELRAHVLAEPEVLRDSRAALFVALTAWSAAVLALAGPTWERQPVPAFRSDEALVVALDLSRSMDAADVEPSRIARSKLKLLDLLERRTAGQTALVVFSTHAFTVTPLTTDTRTIASLVSAVFTDIMPTPGGVASSGLAKAAALLRQTGVSSGEILLMTDSEVTAADIDLAADVRDDGFRVSVLAVGTEQGAPIPQPQGGFVNDANGNVVIPQLDVAGLERLAAAGGGRFARLAPDDRDLDVLFPVTSALPLDAALGEESDAYEADVWRDRGAWLAVLALPLLALCFRRGWILMWLAVLALPAPQARAFEWSDLWQRPDQRGYEALQAQEAERAAQLFEDPQWRSAALYRAGEYATSAATLAGFDSAEAHYNRGNALAKAGKLEEAIGAYDRALEQFPEHEDARYNRDLLEQYLEDNPDQRQQPQPQSGEQSDEGERSEQAQQGESGESGQQQEGESGSEQQGEEEPGEQAQDGDEQSRGEGSDDQEPRNGEAEGENQAQADATEPEEGDADGTPRPEDVEEWASEQAADQWLRRVPQDPGGLLRRKFLYQYQRLGVDQDGNSVLEGGAEARPW